MTHDLPPEPPPDLPDRLHQVESLHLRGWTQRQIAAHLHLSPKTVFRDLKRIEAARLDHLSHRAPHERLHSIALFRHTQALLWKVIDALMQDKDHKSVASAARAVVDAEKAVNATLDSLAKEVAHGRPTTIRDLVAEFTDEELDAPDPADPLDPGADNDGAASA